MRVFFWKTKAGLSGRTPERLPFPWRRESRKAAAGLFARPSSNGGGTSLKVYIYSLVRVRCNFCVTFTQSASCGLRRSWVLFAEVETSQDTGCGCQSQPRTESPKDARGSQSVTPTRVDPHPAATLPGTIMVTCQQDDHFPLQTGG